MPGHYSDKVLVIGKGKNPKTSEEDADVVKAALTLANMKKDMRGGSMKQKKKAKTNPWIKHVKKVAKDKGIKYNEALKIAKKTYKK